MPADALIALAAFAFVTSITPGPNNLMLLASGVNFGVRRTVPHMLGIAVGFTAMVILVGLGLGRAFEAWPALHGALKVAGAAYMLWLAWRLARAGPVGEGGQARGRPMDFLGAAAFQWVNPKAWVMAVGATAAYAAPDAGAGGALAVALVFGAVNLPCVGVWALFGAALRRHLREPAKLRAFNAAMALLLVASLWPIVAGG